ncbi:hypothetical protein KHA80_00690 [Anaerobacillus sp. HL2]|nr:hypothetical protein KHA80_00690 [Anaerobacillus sp. HL2]
MKILSKINTSKNDDKSFNEDSLIHSEIGVPICFDIHHHVCNSYTEDEETSVILNQVFRNMGRIVLRKNVHKSGINLKLSILLLRVIMRFDVFLKLLGIKPLTSCLR